MHATILEKEGYSIKYQFHAGATKPYVVGNGNGIAVAKIAGTNDPASSIVQVRQDARILRYCDGLDFVPKLYQFKEIETDCGKYAYLIREHLEGKDIYDINYVSAGLLRQLELQIRTLHEMGIAGLDLAIISVETGICFAHNVIVQAGTPFLYDFGRSKHLVDLKKEEFDREKDEDWAEFSYILNTRKD
ncbi:MAG: hypothetical protein HGA85_06025 [Nanoarchaeota archaeon]|nr:hypothetical protein [Nanoarchaeota archaeon]